MAQVERSNQRPLAAEHLSIAFTLRLLTLSVAIRISCQSFKAKPHSKIFFLVALEDISSVLFIVFSA